MSKITFAVYPVIAALSLAAAFAAHAQSANDPADQSGYGRMKIPAVSLRTRAEVRAEAIAARKDGSDMLYREGGETVYALTHRAKGAKADKASPVVAAGTATAAQ